MLKKNQRILAALFTVLSFVLFLSARASAQVTQSVTDNGSSLTVSFSYPGATLAIIHYTVTSGNSSSGPLNDQLHGSSSPFSYPIGPPEVPLVTPGAPETLTYNFTYQVNGIQTTTDNYTWSRGSGGQQQQAAAPTFSPAGGAYSSAQTVTLSDSTPGASIYYTTNGATPTTSSALYAGPISVSSTTTINAIAAASGYTNSAVASATYTINTSGGVTQSVTDNGSSLTVSFSYPGATLAIIHYIVTSGNNSSGSLNDQLHGSSSPFSYPIGPPEVPIVTPGAPETLTYNFTYEVNGVQTTTGNYIWTRSTSTQTATPAFSPAAGTYTSAQTVTLSDSTSGASIYYTTNGTTPTTSSTPYTGPITVSTTTTIEAIAAASGYTNSAVASAAYTINQPQTATPAFSPAAGTYTSAQTVTLSDSTSGASIYYTTNGTTPTTSSTLYTGPITVSTTTTIEAIASASGHTNSAIASATYTITQPQTATPTFSPAAGTYTSAQTVTLSDSTSGASIYYTTNGTTPTTSSTLYTGPITVSTTTTIEAIASASGHTNSAIASATYTITQSQAATPVFSPAPGTYSTSQSVTITDATNGSTIYYTTNGTTPTTSSSVYSGPITVSSTETLEAIATAPGSSQSAVARAAYTINSNGSFTQGVIPIGGSSYEIWFTPTWTVPSGVIMEVVYTVTSPTGVVGIQSGVNLTPPTSPSTTWTLPAISAAPGSTINYYFNYYSPSAGGPVLAPATAPGTPYQYLVCANQSLTGCPTPISAVTANPPAGIYPPASVPFPVTLSSSTTGTSIYYTTDGSYPTTTSTKFTAPVQITTDETINAIAVLNSTGQQSGDLIATYVIQAPCTTGPTGGCIVETPYFTGNQPNSPSAPYLTNIGVNMLTNTPGAMIYYTLTPGTTGTTPSVNSTLYVPSTIWLNNSIGLNNPNGSNTWTIEAVAILNGVSSSVLTGTFTVNAASTTSTPWNGNVTVNIVNNSGNPVSWFIYGRESLADTNGDGGSYCGNYVIVVPPPAGSPAGTVATLEDVVPRVPPSYNSGQQSPITQGDNVFFSFAYPAGVTSLIVPPVCSGRIYFSTGSQPLLNAVNTIKDPGPGAPPNGYGWVNPSLNNATDPNQNVAFDYGEFDTAPKRTCTLPPAACAVNPGIWVDTTRVDLFSLPIQLEVTGEDGFDATTGETLSETRDQLRALYLLNVPAEFQGLERPLSIINPSNDASFYSTGGTNSTYLDSYITDAWNQLATTPVTLNLQGFTSPITCSQAGGTVTCNPGGYSIAKPPTIDVLACNNSLSSAGGNLGAVEAQFCAALNRHVADQPFSAWWNPSDFYSATPTNYYAQFFHQHAWDGLTYGFAYDDVGGISSTIFTYSPVTVTFTIGK